MRTSNLEPGTPHIAAKTAAPPAGTSIFNAPSSMFDLRFSFFLGCLLLSSCCPQLPSPRSAYSGPTDSMETVVADINRNSVQIPTLWTQLSYTATLVDPQKHTRDTVSGDGGLLYTRPISLLLTGNKDIAGQVFQLGSNGTEFWVKLRSGADSYNYWWGHYANLDKPCCKPIPIRPDMVLHVLGIGLYESNFLEQPVPVMRFDNENDVYVFDRNVRIPEHWETQEEIWYDRASKLPRRVILYGRDGRIVLKADLSDHTPVETAGVPKSLWPKIARHYALNFPDSQTQITFDFYDPALRHMLRRSIAAPNARSFERTEPDANNKVIQIDANCADTAVLAR